MRTAIVIGGGVAGVATAYELVCRGHRTILCEIRDRVALETSYANGGLLTPAMADPWNAPGVYRDLAGSLFNGHSAMKLRPSAIPSLIGWGYRFLRHSTTARHEAATRANFMLGKYSIDRTRELRERLSLQYDAAASGSLKVFSTPAAMQRPLALAAKLTRFGLRYDVLDAARAVAVEPALAEIQNRIAGAIRFPDDECGDARQFCEGLVGVFTQAGGISRTGVCVTGIAVERGSVSGVRIGHYVEPADTVIVAAGNSSARLVRALDISLPIRPAKGYTVTFDASSVAGAPVTPVIDDALHAAIVPIGTRLRVAGTAEFAGNDLTIRHTRVENLLALLMALMPRVARQLPRASAQPWTGLRPMSADGLPFIGPTHVRGLHVNTGHGHLGWTFAVGSAHLLADLIDCKRPDIDPAPYRTDR